MKTIEHIVGLDLGQASHYTAAVILERHWLRHPDFKLPVERGMTNPPDVAHYSVGHIQRWPLRTPYPAIVADVVDLVKRPPLSRPEVVVDQTGVGAAVVDMLRQAKPAATLKPVLITSGHATSNIDGCWHVPKKELVSTLQSLFQSGRLKIANLPDRETLVKELLAFKVKITAAAHETFESWRKRDHDDLVLATALACWWAERNKPVQSFAPSGVPLHGPFGRAIPAGAKGLPDLMGRL
jgi:hypothetical protein